MERLLREGNSVHVIDDLSNGHSSNLVEARDIAMECSVQLSDEVWEVSPSSLDAAVEILHGADAIVHLAASVSVIKSIESPYESALNNVMSTVRVLEACKRHKIPKMVFASSAAVYGGAQPPISEGATLNPMSPYAASKVAGEAYVNAWVNSFGLEAVTLRFMNLYGPRRSTGPYAGVMIKFAEALSEGRDLKIFGDGLNTRDFTHASDAAQAVMLALETGDLGGKVFNIGTGKATTIRRLAEMFIERMGRLGSPEATKIVYAEERAGEVKDSYADISKAVSVLGYKPRVELDVGLDEFVDWWRAAHAE